MSTVRTRAPPTVGPARSGLASSIASASSSPRGRRGLVLSTTTRHSRSTRDRRGDDGLASVGRPADEASRSPVETVRLARGGSSGPRRRSARSTRIEDADLYAKISGYLSTSTSTTATGSSADQLLAEIDDPEVVEDAKKAAADVAPGQGRRGAGRGLHRDGQGRPRRLRQRRRAGGRRGRAVRVDGDLPREEVRPLPGPRRQAGDPPADRRRGGRELRIGQGVGGRVAEGGAQLQGPARRRQRPGQEGRGRPGRGQGQRRGRRGQARPGQRAGRLHQDHVALRRRHHQAELLPRAPSSARPPTGATSRS